MTQLLCCVDASGYADNICINAAWAAEHLNARIELLHVQKPTSAYKVDGFDRSGFIGLGAKSQLYDTLAKLDSERGVLEQEKGRAVLAHCTQLLNEMGYDNVTSIHERGDVAELVHAHEQESDMIFVGKRGEEARINADFLGAQLEKIARATTKPLFIVSAHVRPIRKFAIAYDGGDNVRKALDFLKTNNLCRNLPCHIFTVKMGDEVVAMDDVIFELRESGYEVIPHILRGDNLAETVSQFVKQEKIDLMLAGAYTRKGFKRIMNPSRINDMMRDCHIPFILFR
jgi:nucleotide-binding universal stress UspA family protein